MSQRNSRPPAPVRPIDDGVKYAPPCSIEAEQSVLGAMLIEGAAVDKAAAILKPEDFFRPAHMDLFTQMVKMHREGQSLDHITLGERIFSDAARYGGMSYITTLYEVCPSAALVEGHARIVKDKAILRSLQSAGQQIAAGAQMNVEDVDAFGQSAQKMVFEILSRTTGKALKSIEPSVNRLVDLWTDRYKNPIQVAGISTGIDEIDRILGGLRPSKFYVIAGRPSMGKTAMALAIALAVAKQAKSVAIFSLEMPEDDIITRIVCSEARVEATRLETGQVQISQFDRAMAASSVIYDLPLFVLDDTDPTVPAIRTLCRQKIMDGGLDLVIIDYIQLIRSNNYADNRQQQIAEIARELQKMALELKIPVIALSQLSRAVEARQEKRPMLSDLRESGEIEQAADAVAFLYRETYYKRKEAYLDDENGEPIAEDAEFIVAKNRNGRTGMAPVKFIDRYAKYFGEPVLVGPTGF